MWQKPCWFSLNSPFIYLTVRHFNTFKLINIKVDNYLSHCSSSWNSKLEFEYFGRLWRAFRNCRLEAIVSMYSTASLCHLYTTGVPFIISMSMATLLHMTAVMHRDAINGICYVFMRSSFGDWDTTYHKMGLVFQSPVRWNLFPYDVLSLFISSTTTLIVLCTKIHSE